jgi:hypothetical protein
MAKKKPRKTIEYSRLKRLEFTNSKDLPQVVVAGGKRLRWVGIGWVDEGEPKGNETLVVEDKSG